MAIAPAPAESTLLTYEQYMTEGHVEGRYDIVEGVRVFMAGASFRHQRVQANIDRFLHRYEEESGVGLSLTAPFDILIRRKPRLQTRQPDVLFISHQALGTDGVPDIAFLAVAPELVVEIVSDSETERILSAKIADYVSIGVQEAWVVRPAARTAEVLRLTPTGPDSIATYGDGQTLQSLTFADLSAPVATFFRP